MRVVGQCGNGPRLAGPIRACCQDADSRVRSAAVKLLGDVPGADSERLIREALADPDRRVRANAIEAMAGQATASAAASLTRLLSDPDNRARANAIKAVMSMDLATAGPCLQRMLADPSAEHRLSALWVVQQAGWLRPAEQVLRLAQQDADRRVRRRALQALGELRRLYRTTRKSFGASGDAAGEDRVAQAAK